MHVVCDDQMNKKPLPEHYAEALRAHDGGRITNCKRAPNLFCVWCEWVGDQAMLFPMEVIFEVRETKEAVTWRARRATRLLRKPRPGRSCAKDGWRRPASTLRMRLRRRTLIRLHLVKDELIERSIPACLFMERARFLDSGHGARSHDRP